MPTQLGEAYVNITARDSDLNKGLNSARTRVNTWVRDIGRGITQGLGIALFGAFTNGVRVMIGQIGQSVQAASSLQESINKVTVVFGESAREILEWSETSATALGQSRQQALETVGTFGNLFRSMGIGGDQAREMSIELVELAADLASFNNIASSDALDKLRSGIVGELEPIRALGVDLSVAAVEAKAMALGLGESYEALNQQERTLARYQIILDQTTLAQGDFARTSREIANQQRILAAQIENGQAAFGRVFTPIYAVILRGINQIIADSSEHGEGILQALATGMVNGIIHILPVIAQLRAIMTYWLKPGSPPRFLPEIDKWGKGALEAYLKGMTQADFGMLRDLGDSIEGILRSFVGAGGIEETDLVARVFGSQAAIARAVNEWRTAGRVSAATMEEIRRTAGPAGDSVAELVRSYFDLQRASERAAAAQKRLDDVTRAYDNRLSPLRSKLDALHDAQQRLRDNRELEELGLVLQDPNSTDEQRADARLRIEEIRLQQRIDGIEKEAAAEIEKEQKKLDAAKRDEAAKEEAFDRAQSVLDQQVKTNALISEEINLRNRLAAEALAEQNKRLVEQERLLRELEAEQRKADAEAKARAAEIERVYQAQLSLNLAMADTPGKIALMRLELLRHKEGSAEYYQILEQIYNLEQQRNKELEAGAGGTGLFPEIVLPEVADLGIEDWAQELADKLQGELDKWFGAETDNPLSLSDRLRENLQPELGGISEDVKNFVKVLDALTGAIQGLVGPVEFLATAFGYTATESELAAAQTETAMDDTVLAVRNAGQTIEGIFNLDWKRAFTGLEGLVGQALLGIAGLLPGPDGSEPSDTTSPIHGLQKMGQTFAGLLLTGLAFGQIAFVRDYIAFLQWLRDQLPGSEPADPSSPLHGLRDAGKGFIDLLWEGLEARWKEFTAWWLPQLQWFRDLLPFSEPKNPASPLRGLGMAGEGIIGQIQTGMERAALNITPTIAANLAGAGTSMINSGNTSHATYGPVNLHFHGPVSQETIRGAVRTADSELKELRRRGEL